MRNERAGKGYTHATQKREHWIHDFAPFTRHTRKFCNTVITVSPKDKILTFRPDDEVYIAMETLRERDGVPFSEQIRRALRAWLHEKGLIEKAAPRRAGTRRKA